MATALTNFQKKTKASLALILAVLLVFTSFSTLFIARAQATGQLSSASVALSNPVPSPSNSGTYTISFKWATAQTVKCVKVVYSTATTNTTEPGGMSTLTANKGTVTGTGLTDAHWSMNHTTDGSPQFEDSTGDAVTAGNVATFPMTSVQNPNTAATFYATISTYSAVCSGLVDQIVVAWATTSGIAASVTVDPSLTFAVGLVGSGQTVNGDTTTAASTSTTIPFGTVAGNAVGIAAQDLTVTTNAAGGYTVYASYSAALTDGATHTIADASGTNASPATFAASTTTSAFGYTTASTTLSGSASRFSGTKYAKFTTTGAEIAGNAAAPGPSGASGDTTRVGYKVAISNTQAPGTYTTTVGLVATPTY